MSIKKTPEEQLHLISKKLQQNKFHQIKEYENAEKKRIQQQRKMDNKLTMLSNFLLSIKNSFNRSLQNEKMCDYELNLFNTFSTPFEHSYGLALKNKNRLLAKTIITVYKDKAFCDYITENKVEHIRTFGQRLRSKIEKFFIAKIKMQEI